MYFHKFLASSFSHRLHGVVYKTSSINFSSRNYKSPSDVEKSSPDMQSSQNGPRYAWHETEGFHYRALRTFYSDDNQVPVMKWLQSDINLSPSAVKNWWTRKKNYEKMMLQSYIPERNQILGNELAAAHFVVFRGGAIKFVDDNKWIQTDSDYKLPSIYEQNKVLQAIDCSNMDLYFEALANFRQLKQVEWLSLNGVENLDDWFLDRISNIFSHSLLYLDIRNCPNYTERGLGAIYKMNKLKILRVDMQMETNFEMTCLLLQECNPNLDIET